MPLKARSVSSFCRNVGKIETLFNAIQTRFHSVDLDGNPDKVAVKIGDFRFKRAHA